MITEDYVSFETAKLLREKGFNEQCYAYYNIFYDNDGKELKLWRKYPHRAQPNTYYLNVPTLQTAMKWLREVHHIFLSIQQHMDMSYVWYAYVDGAAKGCDRESHNNTYERACEAAIKYCLENLI